MSNEMVPKRNDVVDPFALSFQFLVVVAFPRSPSRGFPLALSIARTAAEYRLVEFGGEQLHMAGFGKSAGEAAKALALLDLVNGWKGRMYFSAGQLLKSPTKIIDLLQCFTQAGMCRDTKSHCCVVIDDLAGRRSILRMTTLGLVEEAPERKMYEFPCKLLFKSYLLDPNHPSSYQDQTQAAAVERGIHICPYFDPDSLREAPQN